VEHVLRRRLGLLQPIVDTGTSFVEVVDGLEGEEEARLKELLLRPLCDAAIGFVGETDGGGLCFV
jgi:hypothetical protein